MIQKIKTLHTEKSFIAVDKPAGILTHATGKEGEGETLADWIVQHYPETKRVGDNSELRPGIVHRLDKDTSGVLVVARTQDFFNYFKELLQKREVKKTYLALVHGTLKAKKTITTPIGLRTGTTKHTAIPENAGKNARGKKLKMIKDAVTEIEPVETYTHEEEMYTLLRAYPKTGRTHQIRVHLASIGHPIVSDTLYGKKGDTLGLTRHFLHAASIEFTLKNGKKIHIEAELPKELAVTVDKLTYQ